ncbi:hypothetical protein [Cohnella soli]|uniref:DUF3298 domain-containing protein n=1 Tax=Cohnella soli TaxID=425005 RepID=A0ABW0HNB1_9BACL
MALYESDMTDRLAERPFRERQFTAAHMDAVERDIREWPQTGNSKDEGTAKQPRPVWRWRLLAAVLCLIVVGGAFALYSGNPLYNRTTGPAPMQGRTISNEAYSMVIPYDWTANINTVRTVFFKGEQQVGDVVLHAIKSSFFPKKMAKVESWDVGAGIIAQVFILKPALKVQGIDVNQHQTLYLLVEPPAPLLAYEMSFDTDYIDEATATRVAHSFKFNPDSLQPPSATPDPSESPSPSQVLDLKQQIWADIAMGGDMLPQYPRSETLDQLTYEQTLEGLRNDNAPVRWYAAYRIVEFDDEKHHAAITDALTTALDDKRDYVANAARFALAVLQGDFSNREWFTPSPDGQSYGFAKYRESKWNDGRVWITKKGERPQLVYSAGIGGVLGFGWSPDGKWLNVAAAIQQARWIALVDLRTNTIHDQLNLVNRIVSEPTNGYQVDLAKAARLDPYEDLVEWSPDSNKFLFKYSFADESFTPFEGYGIYNVATDTIEQVFTFPANETATPPTKIKWN